MGSRFQKFMAGRYGMDHYGKFLLIVSLILVIVGMFVSNLLSFAGIGVIVYVYFRMFSKNVQARAKENYAYFRFRNKFTGFFTGAKQRAAERKTYRFYKCPKCRKKLRVPKGKGKIMITCPSCHEKFQKKT